MPELPSGTVTFLFTDIEGSTRRWEAHPLQMRSALARHDTILRSAIEEHSGYVFKTVGDAFCCAFSSPHQALSAALDLQSALSAEQWPSETGEVMVRVALHTGAVDEQGGDYFGQPVNRIARLLSAGHGGQTLLSLATQELVRDSLPSGVTLLDMGEHRLKDLIRPERIYQVQAPGLSAEFPPLNTLDNRPNNLPEQLTPLIGREKEIKTVCGILSRPDVRLLTLTGPGGTGKTRLGLQAAADLLDDFPNGVYFVELAALTDPNLVASTIAQTLGVTQSGGSPILDSLKDYLRDKQILLVLDNFEQVIQASHIVTALLKAAARLKILVTSRVGLRVYGEREYPVPPLSLPDPGHLPPIEGLSQYEAVRLFIERAQALKPDFQVTNDNAPAVADICHRLDGLPLAIELAAARVRMFPPQALLSRLSQSLKVLTGGARDLPARQQTLRGAIGWSYDLLDEGEKQLFRRLAVFQGGRTLEAIEAVCNADGDLQVDTIEGVESLMLKNLLQQREGSDGEARFWMLETIHEYAREKLQENGEADTLYREHTHYFMWLAEQAESHLAGPEQAKWLDTLEHEHDNVRAALHWARHSAGVENTETGLRLAGAVGGFWSLRGYWREGWDELNGLLAQAALLGCSGKVRVKALNSASDFAYRLGNLSSAHLLAQTALDLSREVADNQGTANSLTLLGRDANADGDSATAHSLYEEALMLMKEHGNKANLANSLNNWAIVASNEGDYQAARALYEESLALRRQLGGKEGIAQCLNNLGVLAFEQGDYTTARALYEEGLTLRREVGSQGGIALCLSNLGNVAYMQGDYFTARTAHLESLQIRSATGDKAGTAQNLAGLGAVEVETGQPRKGARLLSASEALTQEVGRMLDEDDRIHYERAIASATSQLGVEAFKHARQEGLAMSMEQAIAYALEEGPTST